MRFRRETWSLRNSHLGVVGISALVAACSGAVGEGQSKPVSNDPIEKMEEQAITALANAVTLSGNTLTVSVRGGETALISLRPVDKAVLVNGLVTLDAKGLPAGGTGAAAVKKIKIVEDSGNTGAKQVLIDYSNGTFATGAKAGASCPANEAAAAAGIWLDAGTAANINTLGVKGKSTADKLTFGANGVNASNNVCPDIAWAGAAAAMGGMSSFIVSMGAGDDVWSAGGDTATGGVFDNSSPLNAGGTKGVTVYGGAGNDTFLQGDATHIAPYETMYGGGQSGDTVDYSSRTLAVNVTVGAGTSNDGDVATTEHDSVENDMKVVNGGAGADLLTACPSVGGTDYPVTFNGNAGNDTLTPYGGAYIMNGGAGNDTFAMGDDVDAVPDPIIHGAGSLLGGAGTDTVDFSKRSLYGVLVNLTSSYTLTAGAVTWATGYVTSGTAQATGSLTTPGTTVTEGVRIGNDVENVLGTDWADSITGNALDNKITGYQGADALTGGLGDDTFDESISAAGILASAVDSGADTIVGGGGMDTVDYSSRLAANGGVWVALDGAAHSGTFSVSNPALMVQVFGAAGDTPAYSAQACAAPTVDSEGDTVGKDVENIIGGLGDDCLFGQPAADAVCATAGACVNQLSGNDGNDILVGYDDDDLLEGGNPSSAGYAAEINALDCGDGQGNMGRAVGGGATAYKLTCQFSF